MSIHLSVDTATIPEIQCRGCGARVPRRGRNHVWCDPCSQVAQAVSKRKYWDGQDDVEARAIRRAQYAASRREVLAKRKALRAANPEKYNAYQRAWCAAAKDKSPLASRARQHRTTVESIEEMWFGQDGECPVCHTPLLDDFHIDHDHATGVFRGLLHPMCNKGLGHFKDDPARLRAAADYLEDRRTSFRGELR